jgi:hypothetical protein
MVGFLALVLGHWAEHIIQMIQIHVMHMPRPHAMGLLGLYMHNMLAMEWLHFIYAAVMLIGLLALANRYRGSARRWWNVTIVLQALHLIEHVCLVYQAVTGNYWFGQSMPCTYIQSFFPGNRAELHFFYNLVVTSSMVYAMWTWRQQRQMAREYIRAMDRKLAEILGVGEITDTRFLEVYE